jgi:type II secretory pathway component HofQ
MLTTNNEKVITLVPALSEEQRFQQKRMNEIQLLLDSLFEREEATVKQILDCLYDVGAINLINKKFANRPLNRLLKLISRYTKPLFKVFALRWFKRNCPQLITEWLGTKVKF